MSFNPGPHRRTHWPEAEPIATEIAGIHRSVYSLFRADVVNVSDLRMRNMIEEINTTKRKADSFVDENPGLAYIRRFAEWAERRIEESTSYLNRILNLGSENPGQYDGEGQR